MRGTSRGAASAVILLRSAGAAVCSPSEGLRRADFCSQRQRSGHGGLDIVIRIVIDNPSQISDDAAHCAPLLGGDPLATQPKLLARLDRAAGDVTDRRLGIRFEILGRLRGTVAAEEHLRIHNISAGGALVETPWPLSVDSTHRVCLESERHLAILKARVRHVRASDRLEHYVVGFEFMAVDAPALEQLQHLVTRERAAPRDVERT